MIWDKKKEDFGNDDFFYGQSLYLLNWYFCYNILLQCPYYKIGINSNTRLNIADLASVSYHQNLNFSMLWAAAPSGSDIAFSAKAFASETVSSLVNNSW